MRVDNVTNFLAGTTVVQSGRHRSQADQRRIGAVPDRGRRQFTATRLGIWDALSGGNFIAAVDLTQPDLRSGRLSIVNASNLTLIQATPESMRGALNTYQTNGRRYFRRSLVRSASLGFDGLLTIHGWLH